MSYRESYPENPAQSSLPAGLHTATNPLYDTAEAHESRMTRMADMKKMRNPALFEKARFQKPVFNGP